MVRAAGMRFVTMRGVGHGWPDGGAGRDPAAEGGRVRDIDATEAFLSFFREFGGL